MSDRRGLAALFLIMMVMAIAVVGVAIGTLYRSELHNRRTDLAKAVQLQAQLLQLHPDSLEQGAPPPPREESSRIYRMLGADGTLAIGRLDGERVVYIDNPWLPDSKVPQPAAVGSDREAPMRQALAGKHGTVLTRNEDGSGTLAAFTAVPLPRLGVVARSDLDAFRGPFIDSATLAAVIALALIGIGALMFFAVGNPMIRHRSVAIPACSTDRPRICR